LARKSAMDGASQEGGIESSRLMVAWYVNHVNIFIIL
jgi:hypothetical protein